MISFRLEGSGVLGALYTGRVGLGVRLVTGVCVGNGFGLGLGWIVSVGVGVIGVLVALGVGLEVGVGVRPGRLQLVSTRVIAITR